jgi:hypothetical protein
MTGALRCPRANPKTYLPVPISSLLPVNISLIVHSRTYCDGSPSEPVMSDLESDRCLLIAHLLCEYLIVAKLGS